MGMTGVVKKFSNETTLQGGLKGAHFPDIKEPVPHLRFGEKIMVGAPLPQPV